MADAVKALREALQGMLNIVSDSRGVDGYHLNGAVAEWDEFPEVAAAESALAAQEQAEPAHRYDVMEALRSALNKLPRYSFWLGEPASVRKVPERHGAWIEWQAAHELFDAEVLDHLLGGEPPAAQPVEMSPEFTDSARAALLWVLWHHQGGSSPVGQPIRYALGLGAHEPLTSRHAEKAKKWAAQAGATTAEFHANKATQPVAAPVLSDDDHEKVSRVIGALERIASGVTVSASDRLFDRSIKPRKMTIRDAVGIATYAIPTARSLLAAMLAAAPAPAQPLTDERPTRADLIAGLTYYAKRGHFIAHDDTAWDTATGEPANHWHDEAGTATVEDGTIAAMVLAGKCTAAHLADEDSESGISQPAGKGRVMLDIKDKPGSVSKALMRHYFEGAVNNTPALKASTPLGIVNVNGEFSHYADHDTDTMWIGFALGMRCAERISKAKEGGA